MVDPNIKIGFIIVNPDWKEEIPWSNGHKKTAFEWIKKNNLMDLYNKVKENGKDGVEIDEIEDGNNEEDLDEEEQKNNKENQQTEELKQNEQEEIDDELWWVPDRDHKL